MSLIIKSIVYVYLIVTQNQVHNLTWYSLLQIGYWACKYQNAQYKGYVNIKLPNINSGSLKISGVPHISPVMLHLYILKCTTHTTSSQCLCKH